MSNPLTQARQDLAKLLKDAGLNAFVVLPNPATPPLAAVGPNEPYIDYEGALMYGEVNVRLQITLVARPGTNEVRAAEIDEMVLTVINALQDDPANPHYFRIEDDGIGRPAEITIAGQGKHIACPIDVFKPVQLAPAG